MLIDKVLERYFTREDARAFHEFIYELFEHGTYIERTKIKKAYNILKNYFQDEDARTVIECLVEIFTVHRYHYHRGDELYDIMQKANHVTRDKIKALVEEAINS